MLTEATQQQNYDYLLEGANTQLRVRRCEEGGGVYNYEQQVITACKLGLIDHNQLIEVLKVLKPSWGRCDQCNEKQICMRAELFDMALCDDCFGP